MLLIAVLAAIVLAGYFGHRLLTLENLKSSETAVRDSLLQRPLLATVLFMLLYVLITAASIPGAAVMTVAAGALFGFLEGTILVSLCSTIGATLAFLISRTLLRNWVQQRYGSRFSAINEGVRRDGAFFLFAVRLVPAVPFFLVNLLMGLTSIRTRTFFLVSQLGMLPGTMAYVFAGTELGQIHEVRDIISPGLLLAFAILGLLPLASKKVLAALQRDAAPADYNVVVIGAGSAGLVASYLAAALKAKVALVEKERMGGDCLNTGCVPSKALIKSTRVLYDARRAMQFGLDIPTVNASFTEVMARVRRIIASIAPHDSEERYRRLGVTVFRGEARVLTPHEVAINGTRLRTKNIILATGAKPALPALKGLEQTEYVTSDTVWELKELPATLVVLGGGPIGCELGQCFRRLGSQVTIVQRAPHLLPKEDDDVAAILEERFRAEGIVVLTRHHAVAVEGDRTGGELLCEQDGALRRLPFDRLLIALGREANVRGFGLEDLGITIAADGRVASDRFLRTNHRNIFVCGDVTGPYLFTHAAAYQAWFATMNALFGGLHKFKADYSALPWTTFTDPEVAHVGLNEREAQNRGIRYEVTRHSFAELDRAVIDDEAEGFVKVLTPDGKDTILGCTIIGPDAGDLLIEFVLAMRARIGLKRILSAVHTYPTLAEINKYAAGDWRQQHFTAAAKRLLAVFHAWQRGGPLRRRLRPCNLSDCPKP